MSYLPKDKKRQVILEATITLAASIGFAGITARKLAQEMGVATGTIHHHFSSLDDLKCEAVRYHGDKTLEHDRQAIAGLAPYPALLRLLLPSNFSDREFESRIWLSAEDEMWRNSRLREAYREAMLTFNGEIETIIQQGMDGGEFTSSLSARHCAWKLIGTSWTLSNFTYLDDEALDLAAADAIVLNDIQMTLGVIETKRCELFGR